MARKIRTSKLDEIFSLYIRTRDAFTCQRCGTYYQERGPSLHCSHFKGRRNRAVRWDPENGTALCAGCHGHLTANPDEHTAWMIARLGAERYAVLLDRARTIPRFRQAELEAIYQDIARKLAALRGEAPPKFRAPKPRKKAKRPSRAKPAKFKRKINGTTVLRA